MTTAPFPDVWAPNGLVCSPDHLASSAGVSVLRAGGNAVDAAIACNAVLAVTTQHNCGLGGDLFALVHQPGGGPPATLEAVGAAPTGLDADRLRAEGHTSMPMHGDLRSVTVPGCVDGWNRLHERFGRLSMAHLLAPAIALADGGFPASVLLELMATLVAGLPGAEAYPPGLRTGDVVRRPGVARALTAIAEEGRDGFYLGELGEGLLDLGGGLFTPADLEGTHARWVEPLAVDAFGARLFTPPPPSQGYLTLAAAWMADALDLPDDPDDALWAHLLVEAAKQAGHDRPDVLHDRADGAALLDPDRLAPRLAAIDADAASALPAPSDAGDTIHLATADANGMAVSLIQSNANGWGARIFEPRTGISLHNRGIGFSLEPGHLAEAAPGRRPPHTLAPAMVQRSDGRALVVGTMGGDSQPQIVLQLLARLLVAGQSPATAVAAPRWVLAGSTMQSFGTWTADGPVVVRAEDRAPEGWITGWQRRGHRAGPPMSAFDHTAGHGNVIDVGPAHRGAADPRSGSGAAVGW